MTKIIGFILCFYVSHVSRSIDLSKVDFRHKYDLEGEISLDYRIWLKDSTYRINLGIETEADPDSLRVRAICQNGYNDDAVSWDQSYTLGLSKRNGKRLIFEHQFRKDDTSDLLFIVIDHPSLRQTYYYDLPFADELSFLPADFSVWKEDSSNYFKKFATASDLLIFDSQELYVYQYSEEFPAAPSPLGENKNMGRRLELDSVFKLSRLFPVSGKLYFIQSDTSSNRGISILGVPLLYPKFIHLTDIIQPLVYISKTSEFDEILNSDNQKLAMDRFWLDITGSSERAVETIREYFRRVTEANQFFTSYKQGWKTDRGMIYIIFGKPRSVQMSAAREIWTYNIGSESLQFTFNRIRNIFSPEHYDLERSEEYSSYWFRQVDLWRKGRI